MLSVHNTAVTSCALSWGSVGNNRRDSQVGAHFGLGASLQDIQKLPAETFQLRKANPVERDEPSA